MVAIPREGCIVQPRIQANHHFRKISDLKLLLLSGGGGGLFDDIGEQQLVDQDQSEYGACQCEHILEGEYFHFQFLIIKFVDWTLKYVTESSF